MNNYRKEFSERVVGLSKLLDQELFNCLDHITEVSCACDKSKYRCFFAGEVYSHRFTVSTCKPTHRRIDDMEKLVFGIYLL